MKCKSLLLLGAVLASLFTAVTPVVAQGTLFTYQGRLNTSGSPANGLYDFRFKVYLDSLGTAQVGSAFVTNAIPTTNGLFTTGIDFGAGVFTGSNYWLEVDVRTNGVGSYTVLTPLQPVTPTPYAIFANTASNLTGTLPATQLSGAVPSANLSGSYGSAVTFNNANGNFSGNGSGLTGVNAATLNGLNSSSFWRTGGNTNTVPGSNYLGTADNQPLEVRVNNTRVMRFEPDTRGLNAGNVIGGYISNSVAQPSSGSDVIVGGGYSGGPNLIYSNSSGVFIGAGSGNVVGPNVNDAAILGGFGNNIQGWDSTISGGQFNSIQLNASLASIGGGNLNTIGYGAGGAIIGGGYTNTIQAYADHSIIAGGWQNMIETNAYESVISGGEFNDLQQGSLWSVIAGGESNTNGASYSFIAGGINNTIQSGAYYSTIGGGSGNLIQTNANFAIISGGQGNVIQPSSSYSYSVIDGGFDNTIQTNVNFAVIGGGWFNQVLTNGSFSTIGGGIGNVASGLGAVIGGGSLIAYSNYNASYRANLASGLSSVVPGGAGNSAAGKFSMAAGFRAFALQDGTFAWGDSQNADLISTSPNQFLVRASGGVGINTNNPGANALSVSGSALVTGSMQVAGPAQVTGTFRSGSEIGTSELPSPAGLVVRRVNSTNVTSGLVIARTDTVLLERDGTHGGFYIGVLPSSGNVTVACMGINSSGTPINFYTTFGNSASGQSQQIYTDAQNVVHFECTFGRTYDAGQHLTTVTLSRYGADYYWSGTLTSTYNQ
ncbi:beta strand repeat-containing protein [Pedosphaera parvula]|uniref:Uncharacterized protein n=1 Tax=Pedosphaera parvula (strain Ellin514) TaxID=320771 RepID=B9XJQ0_PEDPL|nr:hypothetical protein [Pedosphaera parvula]EEF59926.1 hypothetical protein Cflav_PD2730 [Pedosphaera parvula Ellin514]